MELRIYDTALNLLGVIDKITSLIWTRRYWSCGEFKLLVPHTAHNAELLKINRLIMKRGDDEAGQIRYLNIKRDTQEKENIEIHGKFLARWIGKRIVRNQIITTATIPAVMRRIIQENVTSPADINRKIHNILVADIAGINRPAVEYVTEEYTNALLAIETAAKTAGLGFGIYTDARELNHTFRIYDGLDLSADQQTYQPCIFSQEFDNVLEEEFTNSIENIKTTAYVGGEEKENVIRQIVEVNPAAAGLDRDEIFISASDVKQEYRENNVTITIPLPRYLDMLRQRGRDDLENFTEILAFSSRVNTQSNLKYKEDYDLGYIVTCVNKAWGVRVNVRITQIEETYQGKENADIEITFGEAMPALFDAIRQIIK